MSANVALSDTFDTWRTRTNTLLTYTQAIGGKESLKVANTTVDSTSNTTGSIITAGGAAIKKTVYVGDNLNVQGNTVISKDATVNGNTTIGSASADIVTINGTLSSSIVPTADVTSATLGSATKRFGALYVNGVVGDTTTGSLQIPAGTTAQRAGETGSIRYNSTLSRFEGNTGTNFESLAVGSQDQDGDTKITLENSADEDVIRMFTGNSSTASTERLNISIGGNVAIGTGATAGDAKLQVSGTANVSGTVTLGNQLLATGNVKATGAYVNAQTTSFITLKTPTTTIDSNNTIITGNLVVQGTRTFIDTSTQVSKDKTLVLGAGSDVFSNSSFTAANPTVITSKKNGSTTAHGLSSTNKIVVLRTDDATNIPAEAIYTATVVSSTTFTIPVDMSGESAGTLDFAGPQTDAGVDDAGLIIPGTTVHKLTWDDADDSWNFTDPLDVAGNVYLSGDVKVGNNRILASDGGATIVMDTSDNVTVGNDLTVGGTLEVDGNIIKASDGGSTITMDTSDNVTIAGNVTVGGNIIKASDGGSTITMDTSDNVTVAGNVTVGGNIIKASDGGSTITLDTSDNVTIGNDITVGGNVIRASDGGSTITMDTSDNVTLVGLLTTPTLKVTTGAGADKLLKSDADGDLSYVDFGVYNSSGTRLGP